MRGVVTQILILIEGAAMTYALRDDSNDPTKNSFRSVLWNGNRSWLIDGTD